MENMANEIKANDKQAALLDALSMAEDELAEVAVMMEDLRESARAMAAYATMYDDRNEYGAFLRTVMRALDSEIVKCERAENAVIDARRVAGETANA